MLFEPRGVPRSLLSLSDLNSGIIVPAVTGLLRRLEMGAGFGHNASSVERGAVSQPESQKGPRV